MIANNDYYFRLKNQMRLEDNKLSSLSAHPVKYLIVEGYLDRVFFEKYKSEFSVIFSASDPTLKFRQLSGPHKEAKGSVKEAIINLIKDNEQETFSLNSISLYGIIDKDFSETSIEYKHLFVTPTNDLETFLVSNDIFPLTNIANCSTELIKDIYKLAYQFGSFRKAMLDYAGKICHFDGKTENIRKLINEKIIKDNRYNLYKNGMDLSIDNVFNILSRSEDTIFYGSSGEISLLTAKRHVKDFLITNGILEKDNTFASIKITPINSGSYPFWDNIRGHDLFEIAKTLIPNIDNHTPPLYNDFLLSNFIVESADTSSFIKTNLYQRMLNAGILKGSF